MSENFVHVDGVKNGCQLVIQILYIYTYMLYIICTVKIKKTYIFIILMYSEYK